MPLKIGIVGLPNVGKSTLFNAITKSSQAAAENFPFCTIDPNVGIVEVPDDRLEKIAKIVNPKKITRSTVEFIDIAGLVKGASDGEGLGNKFLSHIRDSDAIAMVIRFFKDSSVHHVDGNINPKADKEVIETELIIADLQTVEKASVKAKNSAKSGKASDLIRKDLCSRLIPFLEEGNPIRDFKIETDEEETELKSLHLLTSKKQLYVINLSEEEFINFDPDEAKKTLEIDKDSIVVPICAKTECDLIDFTEEESLEIMEEMGMKESGLNNLIKNSFKLLNLESYFTAGIEEVRSWTMKKNTTAQKAAGIIHSDFEKKFIKGEICSTEDFIKNNGWAGVRENGKLRLEGKDAIVNDGDVCNWKIGG